MSQLPLWAVLFRLSRWTPAQAHVAGTRVPQENQLILVLEWMLRRCMRRRKRTRGTEHPGIPITTRRRRAVEMGRTVVPVENI